MLKPLLHISGILAALLAGMVVLSCTAFGTGGGEIAYEGNRAGNWDIYLLDLSTGTTYNVTQNPADEFAPAWSPDGSKIAFSADRDGNGLPEIYVMNGNGSGVRRVSTGSDGYRSPTWSHDGRSLVFVLGFGQIHTMNEDGSSEQWLGRGFLPSLSMNNDLLLYYAESSDTINADIFVANVNTYRVTNLTNNPTNDWGARWSPDNQQIVFVALRGSRTRILVINADGSNEHTLTNTSVNETSPAWSPDGGRIIYTSDVSGTKQLYVVDTDGGNLRRVTNGASSHQSPAWRPVPR